MIPDETLLAKAFGLLGKNEEALEDILDWTYITDVKVDTNSGQDDWKNKMNMEKINSKSK